jgi:hypothetical protein
MKFLAMYLNRYRAIAALLWKCGRSDLAQALPEQLAEDLDAMRPTYLKQEQVLTGQKIPALNSVAALRTNWTSTTPHIFFF